MRPKKARNIYLIAQTIAILMAGIAYTMSKSNMYKLVLPLIFAAGILTIVNSFIELAFWRCEHCDRYLGRQKFIEYCPHCGLPLE